MNPMEPIDYPELTEHDAPKTMSIENASLTMSGFES